MQQVLVAVRRLVRHDDGQDLLEYGLLAVLMYWRHRSNISRIVSGKEPKIGAKKAAAPPGPEP